VLPEAVPLLKEKAAIVCSLFEVTKEIVPVGVPDPDCGFTVTLKLTGWPCVIVVGVRLFNVVVEGRVVTELHRVTRLLAFTEPRPVAWS
jgi:hypothetical protein